MNQLLIALIIFSLLLPHEALHAESQTDSLKTGCEAKAGYFWNDQTNSCQLKESYAPITDCNGITNTKEKQQCLHDAVLNLEAMKDKQIDDEAGLDQGSIGNLIQGASKWPLTIVHGTFFLTSLGVWKLGNSTCMSVKIYAIAGGVGLITDVASWLYLKYKLDKLKKEFDELPADEYGDNKTSSAALQRHTFDLLSQGYELRSKVEMIRAIAYGVSTALFAAGTALSTYEMIQKSPCMQASTPKSNTPIEQGATNLASKINGSMSGISNTISPLTEKIFIAPVRIALGAAMTGVSTVLTYYTFKAYQISKARKAYIDELKEGLVETGGDAFCEDRTDQSKPSCYCYNEDGTQNLKERSKSDICINYWKSLVTPKTAPKDNLNYDQDAAGDVLKTGCVAMNDQFDPLCKCKEIAVKSAKGVENGCKKVSVNIKTSGGNESKLSSELTDAAQSLLDGNGGSLNTGTLSNMIRNAGTLRKIKDDGIKQINDDRKKNKEAPVSFDEQKMMEKHLNDVAPLLTDSVKSKIGDMAGSIQSKFGEVFPDEQERFTKGGTVAGKSNLSYQGGRKNYGSDKKKNDSASFNLNNYYDTDSGHKMSGIPSGGNPYNKKYKYDAGLEKNSSENIFEMISEAYQDKGLERLFDDK